MHPQPSFVDIFVCHRCHRCLAPHCPQPVATTEQNAATSHPSIFGELVVAGYGAPNLENPKSLTLPVSSHRPHLAATRRWPLRPPLYLVIFSHSDFIDFYFVTLVVTFSTYLLLERGEEEEEPIKQLFKSSTYKLRMFERTKKIINFVFRLHRYIVSTKFQKRPHFSN